MNRKTNLLRMAARVRRSKLQPMHPLGRLCIARRLGQSIVAAFALTIVGCASHSGSQRESLTLEPGDLPSLSGKWTDTRETAQAGKCSIGERTDKRWQRKEVDAKESESITVEADGTITAHRYLDDGTLGSEPLWWGSVNDRLEVTAEQESKAECQGVKSGVSTRLRGQFYRDQKGPLLELTGLEKTCPSMGCEFNIAYRLTRK
jgi:hypothetical protein